MAVRLQDGIYSGIGQRPAAFFGIAFLRVTEGSDAADVDAVLGELWHMWQELRSGRVRDLPGVEVPSGELTALIGYGPKVFDIPDAVRKLPEALGPRAWFRSALPAGGGPLLRGSGLAYADVVRRNPATEDICVQFVADTRLAVDRAIVETWKLLHDRADPAIGAAALTIVTFYVGAQRDDHRSWIDFHDGVSNLRADQRQDVIAIKPFASDSPDAWTAGGTYLAFLRVQVDLAGWRTFDRRTQELAVGRDKSSGCPLTAIDEHGSLVALGDCPVGGKPIWATANDPIAEPPAVDDALLRLSHVQRANHHQGPVGDPSSRRIFRQGYEFFEWAEGAPGFRAGLNFVSFQDDTSRLIKMLTQDEWLGGTNFGGPEDGPPALANLLSIYAAGVYLVPPVVDDHAYPGAEILTAELSRSLVAAPG